MFTNFLTAFLFIAQCVQRLIRHFRGQSIYDELTVVHIICDISNNIERSALYFIICIIFMRKHLS